LLPVAGETTILANTLGNLSGVGITDVLIVTGFAAARITEQVPGLSERYGVRLELLHNDRAEDWNNAYSLWLARSAFRQPVLLVNGDTVHPISVERAMLAAQGPGILLAVDTVKALAEEEMKIRLKPDGSLARINKTVEPSAAAGEYIGVTLIEPGAGPALTEATWRRDPNLYYEDGYQEFVDRGGRVDVAPIGDVPWVEVDNLADLERARELACHY
jgi:choline kinase